MIFDLIRRNWLRLLRVPPEPAPIAGETGSRIFRAAPRYYHLRLIIWVVSQFFGVIALFFTNVMITSERGLFGRPILDLVLTVVLWGAWFAQLVVTYAHVRLDYEQRWYILTDRSLRIREGLVRLTEKTMTFANIQHLTVRQGPLQRLLGIADLEVRSAGGGGDMGGAAGQAGSSAGTHIAYFRGVDNAEEIRAAIRERMRRHRDAGLGDPDDPVPTGAPGASSTAAPASTPVRPDPLLAAVRDLGEEARALREVLAQRALS